MTQEHHADDDLWFVQLSEGEVRAMSLEALDAAYQAGAIDETTLVRADGGTTWRALGEMLGGDAHVHAEPDADVSPGASLPSPAPSSDRAPASAPPPPVVAELHGLDDDVPPFGRSRGRNAVIAVSALIVVIGGLGVTAFRIGSSTGIEASKVTAALPVATAPAMSPLTGEGSEGAAGADGGSRLSDDQRKLLLEADKKREAEAAARRPSSARSNSGSSRPIKIGDPIQKGGSKFDPLNGSL